MFKKTKPNNIKDYLESIPENRKELINFLDKFIKESAPSLKPHFASNMLGYGSFKYINYKKEELDWPTIALANQKNYVSIYVCAIDKDLYLAEKYKSDLGKVNVGKSCIRFKKIEDINLNTLKKVLKEAVKKPGLVIPNKNKK